MEVTKENVQEIIEKYLESKRIRYEVDSTNTLLYYILHTGTEKGHIQVELPEKEEDDTMAFQFFSTLKYCDSLYFESKYSDNKDFDLPAEIDALLLALKNINNTIAGIELHINKIKQLCTENNLNWQQFIDVLYDF